MRIRHPAAAIVSLTFALLAASCLQNPETAPDVPQSADGREAIGEARQEMGRTYQPKEFSFVVQVKDDGEDAGGGWQYADKTFRFVESIMLIPRYYWQCPTRIGMPIRNKAEGRIPPSRAAMYAAEVANAVVDPLLDGRVSWNNQGEAFCLELRDAMNATFERLHPDLGAKVSRP